MTAKDAYMFPVIGSCVLFGLYTLFKLFSKVRHSFFFFFFADVVDRSTSTCC